MKKRTILSDFFGILSKESGEALERAVEESLKRHSRLMLEFKEGY